MLTKVTPYNIFSKVEDKNKNDQESEIVDLDSMRLIAKNIDDLIIDQFNSSKGEVELKSSKLFFIISRVLKDNLFTDPSKKTLTKEEEESMPSLHKSRYTYILNKIFDCYKSSDWIVCAYRDTMSEKVYVLRLRDGIIIYR